MARIVIFQSGSDNFEVILGSLTLAEGLRVRIEGFDVLSESSESSKNNYRLQVLAIHKLLDELEIPFVPDGFVCTDPGCNSKLEHRVRHLISMYKDVDKNLENAKRLAMSEAASIVKAKMLEVLNGSGRKH